MMSKTIRLLLPLLMAGCNANSDEKPEIAPPTPVAKLHELQEHKPATPLAKVDNDYLAVTPPSNSYLHDVSFSPDGATIVASAGTVFKGELTIHDAKTGKQIRKFPGGYGCAAFAADGKLLAGAGRDCVKIWETDTGMEWKTLPAEETMITRLAFGPGDKYLAGSNYGGNVQMWEMATGKKVHTLQTPMLKKVSNWVLDIAWTKDGKRLASAGHQAVFIWDTETGKSVHKLSDFATIVAFSADGKTVATNASRDSTMPEIKLWDAESGREIRTIAMDRRPSCAVFHPDGKRLIVGDSDGYVGTWDRDAGKALKSFRAHEKLINRIALDPNGKTFATAGFDDRTVRIWDAAKLEATMKGQAPLFFERGRRPAPN